MKMMFFILMKQIGNLRNLLIIVKYALQLIILSLKMILDLLTQGVNIIEK